MKFSSILLCLGFLTKVTLQAPVRSQYNEKRGESYLSPIFTEPSMLNGLANSVSEARPNFPESYGLDGGSDTRAIVFPKAIPSAPWPFGRGLEPVWEGPNYWLDTNPEWSIWEEELDTPVPAPFPKPIAGEGAWAPLGAVGDLVDAMPPGDNGILEEACPTCGHKPSAWDKLVKWFKRAWNNVKSVFKKKDK